MTSGESIEGRRGIDHAKDAQPGRDPIELAELAFQAGENREAGRLRRGTTLLKRQLRPHLPQRLRDRAIGLQGNVAGDEGAIPAHAHPRERQHHARRRLERLRQRDAPGLELRFDRHVRPPGGSNRRARAVRDTAYHARAAAVATRRRICSPVQPS
jgi:hypothetical protein